MSFRSKLIIAVLWTLSMVAAAQWRAMAQVVPMPTQTPAGEGTEARFVRTGTKDGVPIGTLTTQIDGKWVAFKLQGNLTAVPLKLSE